MFYNGWEVTKLGDFAWKATKGNNSFNACSPVLLKAMINEHEGIPIKSGSGIKNPYFKQDIGIKIPSKTEQLKVYNGVLGKNKKRTDYL